MTSAVLRSSVRASLLKQSYTKHTTIYRTPMRHSSTGRLLRSYVVSPEQLSEALLHNSPTKISTSPRIIPLCAAWFLPNDPDGRTGQQVFAAKRIPGARFFDIDAVKDPDSPYPHMIPTAEGFAEAMSEMGIKKDDTLVVYDTQELGIFSAPRVGWTLRVFGHNNVHLLNNFRLWVEQGYPTDTSEPSTEPVEETKYPIPSLNPDMVINFRGMKEIVKDYGKEGSEGVQIIDARSEGRFTGKDPEPRQGISSGHMPGSINVPLPEILDPKSKALLPAKELRKVFESKALDPSKPIVSTCGTGVMAAVLDTALSEANFGKKDDRRVYDGSWT
jgi:thiosulfate/3-mercaptopyruvate sulfurtransferase